MRLKDSSLRCYINLWLKSLTLVCTNMHASHFFLLFIYFFKGFGGGWKLLFTSYQFVTDRC